MKKVVAMISTLIVVSASIMIMGACSNAAPTEKENQSQAMEQYLATAETGGREDKVPDPTAESVEIVAIYTADENGSKKNMDGVPVLNPEMLTDKLIEYGVLTEGTSVKEYTTKDGETETQVGPGVTGDSTVTLKDATLDLTGIKELSDDSVTAIADTFIEAFNLDKISILIDGEAVATDVEYK